MIETYRGVVYPNQLDHMDHMNVQWYTAKFDEATWHLFSAIGITSTYIREKNRGMAAIEQTTKYKSEVLAGELLLIRSRILETTEKTIRFLHIMYNAETEKEVATSELLGVHLDRIKRKGCLLPDHIQEKCLELKE
ncbi:acyl-CoA thioesterase [Desulfospira joergensenii]|uniref:acyl-CoA thioesterase n=1 Tax=Desulfospira joergensenii TaxID=53329 RepID=UPI0003B5BE2E|nr:thioesterase family protein [Desulfospira joergensenii]